jgi:hypothetical protein
MKLLIVLGLALALSAQAPRPLCPQGNFDGHWWLRANSCERAIYMRAFVDAGGRIGPEDAVDRYYNTSGNPKQLDLPLKLVISQIWGSADTNK